MSAPSIPNHIAFRLWHNERDSGGLDGPTGQSSDAHVIHELWCGAHEGDECNCDPLVDRNRSPLYVGIPS